MDKDRIPYFVDESLIAWWKALIDRIKIIKENGNVPVLIALSRKMPRLVDWFVHTFLPEHPDLPPKDLFEECELTTELSIPFRVAFSYKYKSNVKENYILLDDIIIHGTTLRSVAYDLFLLSKSGCCGELCYLSSVFLFNIPVNMPLNVCIDDVASLCCLNIVDVRNVISEMASRIRTANLPLDMEYPILRMKDIEGFSSEFVYNNFKSTNKGYTYLGKWGNTATIILKQDSERNVSDFSKVRFFKSDRYLSFEVFSPYSLPDFLETGVNVNIFSDEKYCNLWEIVILPVIDYFKSNSFLFDEPTAFALRQNMGRSLVVWANFLLSLSFMTEKCLDIIPEQMKSSLDIYNEDIDLILGSNFREKVIDYIKQIITEKIFDQTKINIEIEGMDSFAPQQFDAEYSLFKAYCASHSDSIQKVLAEIFNFQNFANEMYNMPQYKFERLFYGETYASLFRICAPYFHEDIIFDINSWIDDQIDNGAVVPKYELFHNKNGYRRWRRFFHAGLNIAEK